EHYFGTTGVDFSFGNTEIVAGPDAGGANNALGAFDSDISQADVNNFRRVPEPGSAFLLLLGLGSLTMAAYRRRS
ncbi:MAG TPA: PEP-CTERM sorting domain-containing protein, partial [Vicinamibacteria bacterium]|nr:PEP-CTERM sorting domain-containing protein [Vicinamibacteria bacterium]